MPYISLDCVFVSGGTLNEIGASADEVMISLAGRNLLTRYNKPRSKHEVCIALECGLARVLLHRLVRSGLFRSEIPPVSSELP
jgi:hypothetical protein